jgi:hypothetical protein
MVLLQAYVDIKKRLHGAPTSGKVSLVVTDIESYSGELAAARLYTSMHGELRHLLASCP